MSRYRIYLAALIPLLAADRISKALAIGDLPPGVPHDVIGKALRFTLVYNRDAAMNISLGAWSRGGFASIAVVGVALMIWLLIKTPHGERYRAIALGLVSGGAIGNLIDRLRWDRGVVDFIDVGLGDHRFWTFNIADSGVVIGALLLAFVFSGERHSHEASAL